MVTAFIIRPFVYLCPCYSFYVYSSFLDNSNTIVPKNKKPLQKGFQSEDKVLYHQNRVVLPPSLRSTPCQDAAFARSQRFPGAASKAASLRGFSELTLQIPVPTPLAEPGSAVAPVWKNLPFFHMTKGSSASSNPYKKGFPFEATNATPPDPPSAPVPLLRPG
jgi:hypothetical protein